MTVEISVNRVIDELVPRFDDIEAYHRIPRRQYRDENPAHYRLYQACERAHGELRLAAWMLNVPCNVIYSVVLTARRWYNRTKWERYLPEADAERLWKLAVVNNKTA